MSPELAVLGALIGILKADASVAALVAGRVYDEVPADRLPSKSPYIFIGPMRRARLPTDCYQAWTVQARLYVVSTGFGRAEGWTLIEAMVQALDLKDAPAVLIAAPFVLQQPLQVTQGGDVIDPLAPKSIFLDVSTAIAREA